MDKKTTERYNLSLREEAGRPPTFSGGTIADHIFLLFFSKLSNKSRIFAFGEPRYAAHVKTK